jgi:hypothetical protein
MGTPEDNEFAGWIQNPKKNIGTPNLSIKTKNFNKKTVVRTLKVERCQKYARTEYAGPTQNPKKIRGIANQPIKTKIFPKKVCLVP